MLWRVSRAKAVNHPSMLQQLVLAQTRRAMGSTSRNSAAKWSASTWKNFASRVIETALVARVPSVGLVLERPVLPVMSNTEKAVKMEKSGNSALQVFPHSLAHHIMRFRHRCTMSLFTAVSPPNMRVRPFLS